MGFALSAWRTINWALQSEWPVDFGSLSSFLQNQATSFNAPIGQTASPKDLRQSVTAGYVTDDYHIFHTFTANVGVRYEVATVPTETAGRLSNLPTLTAATPNFGSPYFSNPTLTEWRLGSDLLCIPCQ